jgi:ribonuclease R
MIEVQKKQILKYLARRDYAPVRRDKLAELLAIASKDVDRFDDALQQLAKQGQIVIGSNRLVNLPKIPPVVTGIYRGNRKGFGFVVPLLPNSYGDLFIAPENQLDAMPSDTVVARVMKRGRRGGEMSYHGVVTEVLERGLKQIVGKLYRQSGSWAVAPDGKDIFEPVIVDDVTAKGAKANDKVVVEIIEYPQSGNYARGVITEVLGKAGLYDSEIRSTMVQFQLSEKFPDNCLAQARNAAKNFDPDLLEHREDITDKMLITIDPPDAKDFDDAISLAKNADGNWVLGVHIADVSSFIPMDSDLDTEAQLRGNSVYLPGKVVPMLPEILSNGICSLQPDQKRYAKSAYITYDIKGNVIDREFANSLICSKARLTYLQADDILKGKTGDFSGPVVALVKDMDTLARAIEKRRSKNGMIHLDLPDTELVLDDDGKVVDANPAENCYPHTIIEMFMVEANEAVATLFDRFNVPFMRRIHPDPEPTRIKKLSRYVKICNFKMPRHLDRASIQDLLNSVKGTSYEFAINTHVLRSLQRAEYAPQHIGHFALASTHYCHFTSPIRRYADLMVHRLLQAYVQHKLNKVGLEEVIPEVTLAKTGEHISWTEQNAVQAERDLKMVLILQMLTEHIGDELNCVVSGVTKFGIFVQCLKYGVEGMIELTDLGLDEWKFEERSQCITGKHSGKTVHLGQAMKVTIVSVHVSGRKLNVAPVKLLVTSRPKFRVAYKAGRHNNSKRRKPSRSRR